MSETETKGRSKQISQRAELNASSAQINMPFVSSPIKHNRTDLNSKNIEDEEFPHGFTLFDASSSPSKDTYKSINGPETPQSEFRSERTDQTGSSRNSRRLSLVTEFDELMRVIEEYIGEDLTQDFLEFAEHQELCRLEWLKSVTECSRLQSELDKANHEIGDYQNKLKNARRLLDQERKIRKKTEKEVFSLEQQMLTARELLFNEKDRRFSDETREKLSFLNSSNKSSILDRNIAQNNRLDTIREVNSTLINTTGSLLSDLSCSRSDGEIDSSTIFKMKTSEWKQVNIPKKDAKSPKRGDNIAHKIVEINSSDKIVATTTLAIAKNGPITATSVIEALPQSVSESSPEAEIHEIENEKKPPSPATLKLHSFMSKTVLCPNICAGCQSRIFFGKVVAKCKDCKNICHNECKNLLPVPCIPSLNTPTQKSTLGIVSDYTPNTAPMVPSLIIHCINEIEFRGLKEIGLYRIPGVDKDIKALKEKLLRIKTIPNLNNVDVHVLCGVVKDFLRSLKEPLVTYSLRKDFIQASEARDEIDVASCFYQIISQLPQPNRDTLAYMILHLNRVAANRHCKMPSSNLCKIFGPTIVGYSSSEIAPKNLLQETRQQLLVMEHMMKIPVDYWSSFINISESAASTPRSNILQTPSTSSVHKNSIRRKFFTPDDPSSASSARKRTKYFGTSPSRN